jgi:hypothetical protein
VIIGAREADEAHESSMERVTGSIRFAELPPQVKAAIARRDRAGHRGKDRRGRVRRKDVSGPGRGGAGGRPARHGSSSAHGSRGPSSGGGYAAEMCASRLRALPWLRDRMLRTGTAESTGFKPVRQPDRGVAAFRGRGASNRCR